MKRLIFSLFAGAAVFNAFCGVETVTSPDGKAVLTINDANGNPTYSISYEGRTILAPSPLGMITDFADMSGNQKLTAFKVSDVKDCYTMRNIKKSHVHVEGKLAEAIFENNGNPTFTVEFLLKNNDLAYRYILPRTSDRRATRIMDEKSGFVMPEGTTTFLTPQSDPMVGFARTMPSYEMPYTLDAPTGENGIGNGYTFPCLFKTGEGDWLLISESEVGSNYCGDRLLNVGGNEYKIGFPMPGEGNGNGTVEPGLALPGTTPYRTISFGNSLSPITESTIVWDVATPRYEPTRDYAYGKGTWSWIIEDDRSMNFDDQIRYIDLAADLGYKTVLVDALWNTQVGREGVKELVDYAAEKGVKIFLWYNSNGYWNDAPQGPHGLMSNSIARHKEMKWMQDLGVQGIKVDFVGSDKQQTMQMYEDILEDANQHGIEVIFHGCTLPRGWERMYPNFIACEAVLASENLKFSQDFCDIEALNATLHPVIRNSVAAMDYGGTVLNKYLWKGNTPERGTQRKTSDVFQLATSVMFQSPVQHFALTPNNLNDAPEWAIEFMKNVPTTWDDIRFIDGYPGKYLIMARKSGDKWYIAGVNAEEKTLKTKIPTDMFEPGTELMVFSDDSNLKGSVKKVKTGKKGFIDVQIPCNGAIVIKDFFVNDKNIK